MMRCWWWTRHICQLNHCYIAADNPLLPSTLFFNSPTRSTERPQTRATLRWRHWWSQCPRHCTFLSDINTVRCHGSMENRKKKENENCRMDSISQVEVTNWTSWGNRNCFPVISRFPVKPLFLFCVSTKPLNLHKALFLAIHFSDTSSL